MKILSVNVGKREALKGPDFDRETGIFKRPVDHPIRVDTLGLASDAVIDTRHHGGPDQAVYLYREEDYAWWSKELDQPLVPGTFGENLTLEGFPGAGAAIGSHLNFDDLVLEVTAPRIPCRTFATRMGDPAFARRFMKAERPGFYCRVVKAGEIQTGESFTIAPHPDDAVSTLEIFRARYRKLQPDELRRFLAAPIDVRTRKNLEQQLQNL
jgi:MOSC domain-containing protein YiiM